MGERSWGDSSLGQSESGRSGLGKGTARAWVVSAFALLSTAALLLTACGSAADAAQTRSTSRLASATTSTPFVVVANDPWGSSWSYNPFSADFVGVGSTLLPLATQSGLHLTTFLPQLASSWHVGHGSITITLRHDARWQNGQPVNSTDVVDSTLLDGVDSNGIWGAIRSVSAIGPSKATFAIVPGTSAELDLTDVLKMTIVPRKLFGRFVTPRIRKAVPSYFSLERSNPSAAQKSPLSSYLSTQLKKLESYSPSLGQFLSDGPFRLVKVNQFEAKLIKSPTFFGASKIHVHELLWEETSVDNNIAEMETGQADYSWTGVANTDIKAEESHGVHVDITPAISANGLIFNNRHYPLNLVKVRQAIAYIVHRPQIGALIGGAPQGKFSPYPIWIGNTLPAQYLTKAQLASINQYSYDPAKATKLLESAGFHKTSSGWRLPNGKPFTLTVDGPAGWTSPTSMVTVVAKYLTTFGIKTTATAVEQPGYWTYMDQGDFQLDWEGTDDLDPLEDMNGVLGKPLNFISSSEPGIGFGPTETVPGVGKVNVPTVLNLEAGSAGGTELRKLTYDWARFIDQELPVLEMFGGTQPEQYRTTHYVDWPSAHDQYWPGAQIVAIMEQGYIRPRK